MMTKYTPNQKGVADLATSTMVERVAMSAAGRVADTATRLDRSSRADYSAAPATVAAGRRNELRAGASVTDVAGTGGVDRTLLTALDVEIEL